MISRKFPYNKLIAQRPGFDWNGRVTVLPGVPVLVHDTYIAGEGILHAALFGLFSLANIRGKGEVAKGQLMRFFAEAAWYPTALLPSQGILWEAVGDRSAQGTLTEGDIKITMLFTFNEQDLIENVEAEARERTVGDKVIPTPWRGHFWNYREHSGMQIPLDDEVRRCMARKFPYGILYTIEQDYILILAIMHCSREPGYWKSRR